MVEENSIYTDISTNTVVTIELAGEDCGWVSENSTGSADANREFQDHNDASQCSQKALLRNVLERQVRDVRKNVR